MKFDYNKFATEIFMRKMQIQSREKREIGIREIAKPMQIHYATLSRAMNGKKLDVDSILSICEWMKAPITKFIKK